MSKIFINHIGTYNDNHKELTINGANNVSDVVRAFMSDSAEDIQPEEVTPQPQDNDQELFKYIHPSVVDDEERVRVHKEVVNLVRTYSIIDICKHLKQLKKDKLVYLNVKPESMFTELHRLGMPDEQTEGFSYKNFMHHFNIN